MPKAPKAAELPPVPESQVQAGAIALLKAHGCIVHRRNTGAMVMPATNRWTRRFIRYSEPGASDTWGLLGPGPAHGNHFELELKRIKERPSLDQINWLIDHNGIGGSVAWWSDSVEDVARVLRHVLDGGRIEYDASTKLYSVKVKGKTVKMPGPCGEFTLV